MRAIIVSVDYDDLLEITLPYNRHHFSNVIVVTSLSNRKSVLKICNKSNCEVLSTDLFYEDGADFNKWRALEWALDVIRRYGIICLMDADVLWPKKINLVPQLGNLYVPRRRIIETEYIAKHGIPSEENWEHFPLFNEAEFAGYSQIFHAEDPNLQLTPWHEINWRHAGGADSFFQMKWLQKNKIRPDFEVLHIGQPGINWCGRVGTLINGKEPEKAKERINKLSHYLSARRGKQKHVRYNAEKLR